MRKDTNKVEYNIESIVGFPISNAFFYFKNIISTWTISKLFQNSKYHEIITKS